jgi:cellobiose phosphorylase
LQDTLTWFARDALVHLGTPRGLEQPNGGAWGVRDVCQGPVEFLLSHDRADDVAAIVRVVFAQQYARRGDWPQWFMFPPFQQIQSRHAHGDVVIWPLKALCDYLEHANDAAILHERVPYTDEDALARTERTESILEHCDRALRRMRDDFLPGVNLPRYGDGDWDDSLQPADPLLRERMVSAWTAELMYQTLRRYAAALAHFGERDRAATAHEMAADVERDFQRHLMPGGVVAGFAVFDGAPARPVEYLLHPTDARTGLRYRLIPMSRGILCGIFSASQADAHLALIRQHLLFPDGARLMDRPTEYQGGLERTFRRSESAAFFGREIGLQYVHAHLRYAEALAVMGRADELWRALLVVNPIAVTDVVTNARARQRNCYFSSSDAAFADRYEASRDYDKLRRGEVPVDAGWRIYSSGPGIYTGLVIRHLFGLRRHFDHVEFDPILPRELDGTTVEMVDAGRRMRYRFTAAGKKSVTVNERPIPIEPIERNPFRAGGMRAARSGFDAALTPGENIVEIHY